jgi:putative proteasome-type protease
MTYCVAMNLRDGMVFVSDSRTNAGVDQVATFRKLHLFTVPGERVIVLQSAGNLATTQSVVSLLRARVGRPDGPHMLGVKSMYDAAELLGSTVREVVARDSGPQAQNVDFGCSFLLGGQIRGEDQRLLNIYPQVNFIESSRDSLFFQIGESKYGKPIIDRVLTW